MSGEIYYLSSLDSVRFGPVRECRFGRLLEFGSGKVAVEAQLSPAVIGQDFDRGDDIESVVFVPRHEGGFLDPISKFPCFVFIAIPVDPHTAIVNPVVPDDLHIIGWGELYRTREDAELHRFD